MKSSPFKLKHYSAALLLGLGAVAGMAAGTASAQNVTVYGLVDQSLRYSNHRSDSGGGGHLQVDNGALTNSRFGFRGSEDLGNDTRAIFRLENGFDPHTGQANQGGKLFGRYAYVGLEHGQYGTVMLGLNGAESFNFFGDFDPLDVGNNIANSWAYLMTVGRLENTVAYAGKFGGLSVGATYGFQQKYDTDAFDYRGVRTSYQTGPLNFGATWQEKRGTGSKVQRMWGAAVSYALQDTKLFLGYLGGRDKTADLDGLLTHPTRTAPTGGDPVANPRKDMTLYTGLVYRGADPWKLMGVVYYGDADNLYGLKDNDGKRITAVAVGEYSLSKRTQVYGVVDFTRVTKGARLQLPGKSNQTGLTVGMRHVF